jgi:hypothetical protein
VTSGTYIYIYVQLVTKGLNLTQTKAEYFGLTYIYLNYRAGKTSSKNKRKKGHIFQILTAVVYQFVVFSGFLCPVICVTMFRSNLLFPSSVTLAVAVLSFKTSEHLSTTLWRNLIVCSFQHYGGRVGQSSSRVGLTNKLKDRPIQISRYGRQHNCLE